MEVLWEHIEWILSFTAIVVGSIYVPMRNRAKERKEKDYQQTVSAIWNKIDKLSDDLSNNHYTKGETNSKIKHKIRNAINKEKIERLENELPTKPKE